MGLITGLLTLPLAPVRGVMWVAEKIEQEAQREYYDPVAIQQQLEELEEQRAAGLVDEEEAQVLEELLVQRLIQGGRHG
jgi:cytochrome c-type biogenesis protein CcmH/NrfG